MLKEYETKFTISEIVKFYVGDAPYIGEITETILDKYNGNQFRYEISSGGHTFTRWEDKIEPYETEIDEGYICDDCLISQILDDIEEDILKAEAREILGLKKIELEEASIENISADKISFSSNQNIIFDLVSGNFRIYSEDNSEYKTTGNAYFSIFQDDEHEDAVRIEINPSWLWTNDDIDELIGHLKLAKVENSNNDFRVDERTAVPLFKIEDGVVNLFNSETTNKEKQVLVVKTPTYYSVEENKNLKEYIEKTYKNANKDIEILIIPNDIKISYE